MQYVSIRTMCVKLWESKASMWREIEWKRSNNSQAQRKYSKVIYAKRVLWKFHFDTKPHFFIIWNLFQFVCVFLCVRARMELNDFVFLKTSKTKTNQNKTKMWRNKLQMNGWHKWSDPCHAMPCHTCLSDYNSNPTEMLICTHTHTLDTHIRSEPTHIFHLTIFYDQKNGNLYIHYVMIAFYFNLCRAGALC